MIIQKMNNVLVKHSKILFGLFTAIIIVSFVWFFTPGVDGSLFFGGKVSLDTKYGTAFEQSVTYRDLQEAMKTQTLLQAAYYGISPSRLPDISEQEAFQLAAFTKTAEMLGFSASDAELNEAIRKVPAFQEKNVFSADLYKKYREKFLVPSGLDFKDLEGAFRTSLAISKMMESPIKNVVLTDGELQDGKIQMLTSYTVRPVIFKDASFMGNVKLTEQEIKAFYDASKGAFMTEPVYGGLLAAAPLSEIKVTVTDAQIKQEFEQNKALYAKDAKDVKLEKVSKDIRKKLTNAKAQEIALGKVRSFHKSILAFSRENKDEFLKDPKGIFKAEAAKHGLKVIGLAGITPTTKENPAIYTESAVVKALTSLKNVNSMTNVISGEKGAYKALLTYRKDSEIAPYEDAKVKVELALRAKKAQKLAEDAVKSFRLKMKESKAPAKDLEKIAKQFSGTVEKAITFSPFELETNPYQFNLELYPAMMLCLNSNAGELSKPNTRAGIQMFGFLDQVQLPDPKKLDSASKDISAMLLGRKRQIARMEFNRWILENCKIIQRRQQEGSR